MLPAYRESLHVRYPPVCDSCLPLVEDEIRQKEQMARVKALGGSLKKGKERRRKASGPEIEKVKSTADTMFWWKVRGYLWALSFVVSIICSAAGEYTMCRPFFCRLNYTLQEHMTIFRSAASPCCNQSCLYLWQCHYYGRRGTQHMHPFAKPNFKDEKFEYKGNVLTL